MAPDRGAQAVTPVLLTLVKLKNCLVNLPPAISHVLLNTNIVAQNVIVEVLHDAQSSKAKAPVPLKHGSLYLGWTGLPSKARSAPSANAASRPRSSLRDKELPSLEIDAAYAHSLGLQDGQSVSIRLHRDPPLAHTVHIEPLTADDWEILELHASFLELNLVNQIRALPNPRCEPKQGQETLVQHLLVHLSPTSSAKVRVTDLAPTIASSLAFAKLDPGAEIIVAPKSRLTPAPDGSVVGQSRRQLGPRSTSNNGRFAPVNVPSPLLLRMADRRACEAYFDADADRPQHALEVWLGRRRIRQASLSRVDWVTVELFGLVPSHGSDDSEEPRPEGDDNPTSRFCTKIIVAKLSIWSDPPDDDHVALSKVLCASLGCQGVVGGLVKLAAAPSPIRQAPRINIYPFQHHEAGLPGIKLGGDPQAAVNHVKKVLDESYATSAGRNLLQGPLTHGMRLPPALHGSPDMPHQATGWPGGLLHFDQQTNPSGHCHWFLGSENVPEIRVLAPISPSDVADRISEEERISPSALDIFGIDSLLDTLQSHIRHASSVLLTGGLGAGKTSVAREVGLRLQCEELFCVSYLPCRKLATEDVRLANIKEVLTRVFRKASWGARLGGKSVVILDDLDRLCPAETELEDGTNSRNRQISEHVSNIVRQYCHGRSNVMVLATAADRDSTHGRIVASHIFHEIVPIKSPDKACRKDIVEGCLRSAQELSKVANGTHDAQLQTAFSAVARIHLHEDVDLTDLMNRTDGYMPGDLKQLIDRARNEALISHVSSDDHGSMVILNSEHFEGALKGFTPASLRNVTLTTSTTTFHDVGGLRATRQTLLETLQYPTRYAPIFAQCPLRLRSGLLLYGYPGCGKTLLASAVAGECGLNFISVKGPEILNKYIGASEKSVRDLFDRAEAARPCVLFFDEFDSIAPKRGHDSTGVTDRVVNQLLTEMDGAEGLSGVYVLAATSRPDLIDPALLRPGRLDKSLLCGLPDQSDRVDILEAITKQLPLSSEARHKFAEIACSTEGFSGADLQALMGNAQLEAIHDVLHSEQSPQHRATQQKAGSTTKAQPHVPQYTRFLYGPGAEGSQSQLVDHGRTQNVADNYAVHTQFNRIKEQQHSLRTSQRGRGNRSSDLAEREAQQATNTQVIIQWQHITKSLRTTNASIAQNERRRLQGIYHEFVAGRSGEMPDGEASKDIGGRTSLM